MTITDTVDEGRLSKGTLNILNGELIVNRARPALARHRGGVRREGNDSPGAGFVAGKMSDKHGGLLGREAA